ncbi:MAG: proline racemase family protein [Acidobacteria bacterium]|nr:proline racemase family protein [Acidobacteriota bacterium]
MLEALRDWQPPADWPALTTIDAHTGGEPLRIVTGGLPEIPGSTMIERRRYFRTHLDHVRQVLINEPRGHREMYGCVVTPPVTPGADFGVLFLHNEGYSTMCGHGIIAVATVAVETGFVAATGGETALAIDTPAGLVRARVLRPPGEPASVAFVNVPSFVAVRDATVDVAGVGGVRYDLAFGGAFYAYVEAAALGLQLVPEEHQRIIDLGMAIKRAVATATPPRHPDTDDLGFVYGTIFVGRALTPAAHSRNVCVFANGQVDRSPTGTGVSGRAAIHHARGELSPGVPLVIESLVGSRFEVRIVERTRVGPHEAVVPEVRGSASITGVHRFVVDPADTLPRGVFLG